MADALPPGTDIYTTPAGIPPAGKMPLDPNGPFLGYQYYAAAGVGTALMTIFMLLRLYTRAFVVKALWWDDLALIIAYLAQVAYTGLVIYCCTIGVGTDSWNLTIAQLLPVVQYAQPTAYVIVISTYFTKLSLLLLYFRIFKPNRIVYIGTIIGMVTFTIYYVIVFFLYIFVKATEIQLRFTYSVAVINVVTDVYILCLPFIGVWQLQLSAVKKRRVSAIFMTGLLAVALSIVGAVYRWEVSVDNFTRTLLPVYIVNTIEVDIGLICACAPVLAALFGKSKTEKWWTTMFRSLRSSLQRGSHGSRGTESGVSGRSTRPNRTDYTKQTEHRGKSVSNSATDYELDERSLEAGSARSAHEEAAGAHGGILKTTVIEQSHGAAV